MKRFQIFFFGLLIAVGAGAQQLPTSSLHDMYGVLHNPATAGSLKHASIGGIFKKQWRDMPGAPQTGLLFANAYLPKAKIGLGGYLYNDQTGPLTYNGLQTAYSYHIPMKNNSSFSLGLEARVMQYKFDRAKLQESLGNDPVIMGEDSRIKADAGFGVAYTSPKFQLGASVSQIVQSRLNLYDGTEDGANLFRHFYGHGHYNWDVDKVTRIIPHFLVIYLPNAPTSIQGGVRVEHHNLFWYGLALKKEQSWMISAGLRLKQRFNIGYSFDIYTTPLSVFNQGSNGHEVMLRYEFIK